MYKMHWLFAALICSAVLLICTVPAANVAQTSPPATPTPDPNLRSGPGSSGEPGSASSKQGQSKDDSSASGSTQERTTPRPSNTCQTMMPEHIVISGADEGTECKVVGFVGVQSLDDAGITAAVDIWAWTSTQVEVCFRGTGSQVFLDAATSPRAIRSPSAHVRDAMTCTNIQGPGTVILSGGSLGSAPQPPQQPAPASQLPISAGCQVTTTATLYVRATPGGAIVEITLPGTTLSAVDRVPGWYKVNYWVPGWVSADYVVAKGC